MGYARYIGRVGGLAVALGVGFAVATTPGVAWAEPDAGSASSSDSSRSTSEQYLRVDVHLGFDVEQYLRLDVHLGSDVQQYLRLDVDRWGFLSRR